MYEDVIVTLLGLAVAFFFIDRVGSYGVHVVPNQYP